MIAEASLGAPEAAARRLDALRGIPELPVVEEVERLAADLLSDGAIAPNKKADALHIAIATVHRVDYLLTWNCRHIDNAAMKPLIRSICAVAGYVCPEICTPLELLQQETPDV